MYQHKNQYNVTKMAKLLGVSRSGYYAWEGRKPSLHKREDQELLDLIRDIFEAHRKRYGSPRIWEELRDTHGRRVSRKRVERLMRENGLQARRRRKFVATTDSSHGLSEADNLLNREFTAMGPGEKGEPGVRTVSDITYLRTSSGWLYLTVVLDLWDRKVIGWAFSDDMAAVHICEALKMALGNRAPREGMLFHSDRGVQYCSSEFRETLTRLCPSVRQSMSRKGNCWDNACAESFFKTLKWELDVLEGRHTKGQVRTAVFEYIEIYYNKKRRHSALGYATPVALITSKAA
jgi:transposase InsO family protein